MLVQLSRVVYRREFELIKDSTLSRPICKDAIDMTTCSTHQSEVIIQRKNRVLLSLWTISDQFSRKERRGANSDFSTSRMVAELRTPVLRGNQIR